MSKIVSIHQPSYFPWLGLLDKINKSDEFILLDIVQLNDSAFQSRNIFLDNKGKIHYLVIPIQKKGYQQKMIKDLKIADNRWQKKHNGFFIANYKKHPFFDEIYPEIKFIFEKKYNFLLDVLIDSMNVCNKLFNINTKVIFASELNIDKNLKKDDLIIEILRKVKASEYLSGIGAKVYQDEKKFKKNGILLKYQNFIHPVYPQKNSINFISGLSSLDVLFNLGCKNSEKLLKGNL
jgi:hypothetical protein